MEFTAEWKSLWPISSTFSAPLLIPNNNPDTPFGPLIFNPKPNSSTTLLQSSSLSPRLPPPYPQLSLPRFLQNHSSVPSSAASFCSLLGPQLPNYSSYFHGFNSLQLLQIPDKKLIVAFFPTGENSDHVGFSLLSVKDGILDVHSQKESLFQVAKEGNVNRQRITRLLVNPVDALCSNENGDDIFGDVGTANKRKNVAAVVAFLMVCTDYSVNWYRVGLNTLCKENEFSICLDYLGCANAKMLKGNAVMSACWSPHLKEECLVLLENGDLLLFDVNYSCGKKGKLASLFSGNNRVINKKMQVSLNDKLGLDEKNGYQGPKWVGCEFSWHPRIFIASHCSEVFLVDMRSAGDCNVCCLLKLEMLSMGKNDGFQVLSKANSDMFSFTVATRYLLLLCDVRKPLMPVLRWSHGLENPRYMTFFRLSELRVNVEDTKYKWASESGYCILLGSFWDGEFSLFCYGPDGNGNGSVSSGISKFCNSYYAWGLPSALSLSLSDCNSGSCLLREEFSKTSLPVWIDWRQKKQLILGFGILEPDISAQLSSPDSFGGFIMIRLTSSGKLEAQHYLAAWESEKISAVGHKRKSVYLEENLLYNCNNSEYEGEKKFQHLRFDFLNAYLEDKLAKHVVKKTGKRKEGDKDAQQKYLLKSESNFHQEICHRLKAFGLHGVRSSLPVPDVLKDVSLPTSIHEIALRSTFAALPTNMLQLAFSTYSDFNQDLENQNEPLEFLDLPGQLQVPPFPFRKPSYRSNKWSSKVQPSDTLVGPVLPPHFMTILHKLCMDGLKEERELYLEESEGFSAHSLFRIQCDRVVELVEEQVLGSDTKSQDDDFVSLGDDTEDMSYGTQKVKFSYHRPSSLLENPSSVGLTKPGYEDHALSTHVFRRNQEHASDLSAEMVSEIGSLLSRAGSAGLGRAAEVLDTLGLLAMNLTGIVAAEKVRNLEIEGAIPGAACTGQIERDYQLKRRRRDRDNRLNLLAAELQSQRNLVKNLKLQSFHVEKKKSKMRWRRHCIGLFLLPQTLAKSELNCSRTLGLLILCGSRRSTMLTSLIRCCGLITWLAIKASTKGGSPIISLPVHPSNNGADQQLTTNDTFSTLSHANQGLLQSVNCKSDDQETTNACNSGPEENNEKLDVMNWVL
ncbi:hypothetical protein Salat_2486900 [Sesamum alatum]|uniref:Uncharacterized protein n=1 Tax=Sesamum alatum TaxID=300844 RepID=A0AAE2CC09_9LAMI|nr:hypothetical protein Salat_2486900 [Sesamum alatum]